MAAPCHSGSRAMAFKLFARQNHQGFRFPDANKLPWAMEFGFLSYANVNHNKEPVYRDFHDIDRQSRIHRHTTLSTHHIFLPFITPNDSKCQNVNAKNSNWLSRSTSSISRVRSQERSTMNTDLNLNPIPLAIPLSIISLSVSNHFSQRRNIHLLRRSRSRSNVGFGSKRTALNIMEHITMDKHESVSPKASFRSMSIRKPHFHFASLSNPKSLMPVSMYVVRTYVTGRSSASHYYDILGLTPKATQKQIKSAYYKMSKMHHPDVAKTKKSHTKFTEINEAYEVLGNIQKRRLYDRGLLHQRDPRTPYNPYDMDFPGSRTRQSPFERGERPPPPRGRTKVYNFDEFYKQHYNEVRERRSREWNEFVKQQDMKYKDRHFFATQSISLPLMSVLWIMFVVLMYLGSNRSKDNFMNRRGEMYDSLQYAPNGRPKE